jgi:hypothetical protein
VDKLTNKRDYDLENVANYLICLKHMFEIRKEKIMLEKWAKDRL